MTPESPFGKPKSGKSGHKTGRRVPTIDLSGTSEGRSVTGESGSLQSVLDTMSVYSKYTLGKRMKNIHVRR
jgi:hypothetical protein